MTFLQQVHLPLSIALAMLYSVFCNISVIDYCNVVPLNYKQCSISSDGLSHEHFDLVQNICTFAKSREKITN